MDKVIRGILTGVGALTTSMLAVLLILSYLEMRESDRITR